jgi:hypothetical protein
MKTKYTQSAHNKETLSSLEFNDSGNEIKRNEMLKKRASGEFKSK